MSLSEVEAIAAAGLAVIVGASWVALAKGGLARRRIERREHRRSKEAQAAAVAAAVEDEAFAPDRIRAVVEDIVAAAAAIWSGGSPAPRADSEAVAAWARSLTTSLGSGLRLRAKPSVDLLQVINRPGESEDRVVLRVRVRLRRRHPLSLGDPHRVTVDQRWTLGRSAGMWTLRSVDGDPLAPRLLTSPLIAAEWQDETRLKEESWKELAGRTAPVSGTHRFSELVSSDMPARQQLLELSQIDGRFSPELLHATLEHILEAWQEAGTGSPEPLEQTTSELALMTLLHPIRADPSAAFHLHDATIDRWEPRQMHLDGQPPEIGIALTVTAVRYVVMSATGTVAGSDDTPHQIALVWTLAMTQSESAPWTLIRSSNPAAGIPGTQL